jgi:amino-acid N-acetyltransferase
VLWEDLAEVRTVAVNAKLRGQGVGHQILESIISRAEEIGVKRLFCLTFETEFFGRHGFQVIEGTPVAPEIYAELLRSYDAGVAEFLDLEAVKPNTLGNTRMLKEL